ncbi:hypothetical protein [Pseudogracilibacillus sp. SO30301A]|uniref:hypothetical protein n=1 Tax=Pseudogracilibacillus sp. SO30301A TaxID=3098291 RepID=UPI00300E25D6
MEFIQRKIDTASAGLGNVKVPVFYKEKLSTGSSDITLVGMEIKSLSEVQPQMFAVKGDGVGNKSTKGIDNVTRAQQRNLETLDI